MKFKKFTNRKRNLVEWNSPMQKEEENQLVYQLWNTKESWNTTNENTDEHYWKLMQAVMSSIMSDEVTHQKVS